METVGLVIFGIFFVLVLGTVVFRFVRHGSLEGALFDAPVLSDVGEVQCQDQRPLRVAIRVHRLGPSSSHQGTVGVALVAKGPGSYKMMPAALSAEQARSLAALLGRAADEAGE